jgi:hypothetical protein
LFFRIVSRVRPREPTLGFSKSGVWRRGND